MAFHSSWARIEHLAGQTCSGDRPARIGWGSRARRVNDSPESLQEVERFVASLATLPWFRNLGEPTPPDAGVERIYRWEEWPGPLEPGVDRLAERQQALYDSLMQGAASDDRPSKTLWDRVHNAVFDVAAAHVPYDPNQDTYHAP